MDQCTTLPDCPMHQTMSWGNSSIIYYFVLEKVAFFLLKINIFHFQDFNNALAVFFLYLKHWKVLIFSKRIPNVKGFPINYCFLHRNNLNVLLENRDCWMIHTIHLHWREPPKNGNFFQWYFPPLLLEKPLEKLCGDWTHFYWRF